MAKKLKSVFTSDMNHCYFTGTPNCHIHHIFYGSRRKVSEIYGFVIPLSADLHVNGKESVHENPNAGLDLLLKQMAQTYYEKNLGTRKNFIGLFGKSWL